MARRVSGVVHLRNLQRITLFSKVIRMGFILTFILVVVLSFAISVILHCTRDLSFVQFVSLTICGLGLIGVIVVSYLVTQKYLR